ncbi:MAG: GAF domain-containing protein [Candidatus Eisenbacteria bacterium]|nr:GAF domain-containing protein [Candidatus Eisenbacteria bacterium]
MILRRFVRDIAGQLDGQPVVQSILNTAIHALGAQRGILFLGSGDDAELHAALAIDIDGDEVIRLERLSRTILKNAQEGELLITSDAMRDPRFRDAPSVQVNRIRSVLCAPLIARGKRIGLLYLDAPSVKRTFSEKVRSLAETLATLAAATLENARLYSDVVEENLRLRNRSGELAPFDRLVAVSESMEAVKKRAVLSARCDDPVLISGETGTGKELLARSIYEASPRFGRPFHDYNCAAVPPELMESIFFGHVRGSFTGAVQDSLGLFRQADKGVLFLDEIAEMRPEIQTKLLRTLEDGHVQPVGGDQKFAVDVRLIAASSRDLAQAVHEGRFRQELYYRIHVLDLHLPPLRERPEDIPLLVDHFLRARRAPRMHDAPMSFTRKALEFLQSLPWPGNVRQLKNLVTRVTAFASRPQIGLPELEPYVGEIGSLKSAIQVPSSLPGAPAPDSSQRERLAALLDRVGGNISQAARELKIHRNTLARRLRKLGIDPAQYRTDDPT